MKVTGTRRVTEKLGQIMQSKELSWIVDGSVTNAIATGIIMPSDVEMLRQAAVKVQKRMPECSVDKVMLLLMVESIIKSSAGQRPTMKRELMRRIAMESRVFDVKEFNKNPYIKNIDFTNRADGDYELRYNEMLPYELDIYNIPKRSDGFYVNIPRICCFPEKFSYPTIVQKSIQKTWMSVSPNEVFTMEKPIKNAGGRVLTLGCGMGYFAYMASLKEEVESVTIVELEQSVINLFEKCLLPQFENKDKITVVKADAAEFLREMEDGAFDYCFADIWLGVNDIAPYFAIKEIGRKLKKTKIDYWIEESIAVFLSDFVWPEMLESFLGRNNNIEQPPAAAFLSKNNMRTVKYIHKLFEEVEITKPEHIDYYLKPENIINIINDTDVIY